MLRESLLSALNQTETDTEIIVVDDGSTDDTALQIKSLQSEHPGRIVYVFKENGERGAARNFGAKKASGQWLNFFDSDDLLYPWHLSTAKEFILSDPKIRWFHLHYDYLHLPEGKKTERGAFKGKLGRQLIRGNHLSCNGVFISRDFFLSDGFCEDRILAGMEDWELWLRLAVKAEPGYSNTITSSIVQHRQRSVLAAEPEKLKLRVFHLIKLVESNPQVKAYLADEFPIFRSSCYSYLSLHLALMKSQRLNGLVYLFRALLCWPGILWQRRFYAILKHLI